MSTPVSSSTSYCTGAQLVQFYDVRWIGDRLQDAGIRVAGSSVPSDPNLAALLLSASGLIESKALRANKYTPADLQALTGASAAYLQRLTADVAVWMMLTRRNPAVSNLPPGIQMALQTLQDLSDGVTVFGLQEKADAGKKIKVWNQTGQIKGPYNSLTSRTDRYLGDTSS